MASNQLRWRSFISLSLFLSFGVLLLTSLLMFLRPYQEGVALLHIIFGFWLLLLLLWHINNNVKALMGYVRQKLAGKTNLVSWGSASVFVVLLAMAYLQSAPFMWFYQWGQSMRAAVAGVVDEQQVFQFRRNQPDAAVGPTFTIQFQQGPFFMWPQYAIWLETMDGQFIQPLYITSKLASNNFANKVTRKQPQRVFTENPFTSGEDEHEIFEYQWDEASKHERIRPESLPVFLHALGLRSATGMMVPEQSTPLLDAYAGATMTDNFLLTTRALGDLPTQFKIRFEINQSFDFNDYYSSDRFPDDAIYSGDGFSAQPSVIYEAVVDRANDQQLYRLTLVGHGHHSGKDGKVHSDISKLTTAIHIVDRVIVELDNSPIPDI